MKAETETAGCSGVRALRSILVLTLGGLEVEHVAVLLEHVDLVNAGNGLDIQLLEGSLELLVLAGGTLLGLDLPAGSTLST